MGCATSRSVKNQAKVEAFDITPTLSRRQIGMSFKAAHLLALTSNSSALLEGSKQEEQDEKSKLAELDTFDKRLQNCEAWKALSSMLVENIKPTTLQLKQIESGNRAGKGRSIEVPMISVKDLMHGLDDDQSPSLKFSPSSYSIPSKSQLSLKYMPSHTIQDVNGEFARSSSSFVKGLSTELEKSGKENIYLSNTIQSRDHMNSLKSEMLACDLHSSGKCLHIEQQRFHTGTSSASAYEFSADQSSPFFDPDLLALYEEAVEEFSEEPVRDDSMQLEFLNELTKLLENQLSFPASNIGDPNEIVQIYEEGTSANLEEGPASDMDQEIYSKSGRI